MISRRGVVAATVLALLPGVAGGCAPLSGPPVGSAHAARSSTMTHEHPSPTVRQHTLAGAATPSLAVAAFAVGYVNWTAVTVSGRMRGLAALSVGQARSLVTIAAAQTAGDYELHQGGVANSGIVEAIAPVLGQPHRYAVVTRERTTATGTDAYRGLAPTWHVALATVTATARGWVVSGWQPEN